MRAARLAAGLAAIALLAGCGSGAAPKNHVHLTAFEQHGRTLFIRSCGSCHALADAGTSGIVGPALNQPWAASRIREVIADGPGQMPAGLLSGNAAAAVAAYIAAATGG
ncbi:MAG TPA: cytochrome c [Gaiellaceae bacterium]|nr:cytochrome c [Gaiellaceae bacterium]